MYFKLTCGGCAEIAAQEKRRAPCVYACAFANIDAWMTYLYEVQTVTASNYLSPCNTFPLPLRYSRNHQCTDIVHPHGPRSSQLLLLDSRTSPCFLASPSSGPLTPYDTDARIMTAVPAACLLSCSLLSIPLNSCRLIQQKRTPDSVPGDWRSTVGYHCPLVPSFFLIQEKKILKILQQYLLPLSSKLIEHQRSS